jgi:hypothetical protein
MNRWGSKPSKTGGYTFLRDGRCKRNPPNCKRRLKARSFVATGRVKDSRVSMFNETNTLTSPRDDVLTGRTIRKGGTFSLAQVQALPARMSWVGSAGQGAKYVRQFSTVLNPIDS